MRQGPHHAAQKSTSTGTLLWLTISSNSAGSAAMGSAMAGNGDLQAPQRPASARCLDGIRFCLPQDGQFLITGITGSLNRKMLWQTLSSLANHLQRPSEQPVKIRCQRLVLRNRLLDGL